MDQDENPLHLEVELIASSLLPAEQLTNAPAEHPRLCELEIRSSNSNIWLHILVSEGYPDRQAVHLEVKGQDVGREEAEGWNAWVKERLSDWQQDDEWVIVSSK
jgi:hypothetical protein